MHISRRTMLRFSGGALAASVGLGARAVAMAAPAIVGVKEVRARTLSFDCYYTGEHVDKITYWADGQYVDGALEEINRALRDWRASEVHPIDVELLDLLHQL